MRRCLFLLFVFALAAGAVQAQEAADSMRIFYRRGYRNVDPSFRDNRAQLDRFLNSVGTALKDDRVGKIVIRSYASPDGTVSANERLSAYRAEALKAYLVREGNVPAALIEYHAEGIAWGTLREQVAASDMVCRNEVLDILDHTPLWIYDGEGRIVDGRKKRLMDLRGGKPYTYLSEHFFPDLRNSSNTMLYLRIEEADSGSGPSSAASQVSGEEDGAAAQGCCDTPAVSGNRAPEAGLPSVVPVAESGSSRRYPKHIVGLYAGYCTSWIASYGLTSSTRPGYEVGLSDRIRLGRRLPFYFRTGLAFTSGGYEITGFDDSRTTMNYLRIPVGVDYTVSLGERVSLVPGAGFYYAVGVGGKRRLGGGEVSVFGGEGGFSRHDMGFSCGTDVAVGRFSVGVVYRIGLINIDKADRVYGNDSHMVGYKNVRNRCFLVRMGVNF